MNPPSKEDVVETLETIAHLLDLKGENPFKIRAYQTAARALETYRGDLPAAAAAGQLATIEGIGHSVAEKVSELLRTGRLEYYEELRAEFPAGLFELFEVPGLGARKIRALYEQLHVKDAAGLEAACRAGQVAALGGFGEKTQQNLLTALARREENARYFRLGDAAPEVQALLETLRAHPAVGQVSAAGSFRRGKEVLHDLDLVVSTRRPAEVREALLHLPAVAEVLAQGDKKVSVRLRSGMACDARIVSEEEYVFALHHFTGSKEHHIALRNRALHTRGWTINEYRVGPVARPDGQPSAPVPPIHDETEFYRALGLDYIPPELREGQGEIEAAENHAIPRLVELENLRGTFHCHTYASDGNNSLEEMAEAARALGLQYLGIADHSKSSFQAHGLDENRLLSQVEDIARLNARYAAQEADFRVFAGVECDVLRDGSLDFSDEILGRLDYVVASVHNSFGLPEAEMTRRIVRAAENRQVTFLGHLSGRLLLSREAYALDVAAVIEAAAATGTVIELNANPRRLDMDWRWWKTAKEKGVSCVINPDAHRVQGFQDLRFGVLSARKGWLTRADVINCLPLGQIEPVLARKRR